MKLKDYSVVELARAIRDERRALIIEKRRLTDRLSATADRIAELDKAEALLEGGF